MSLERLVALLAALDLRAPRSAGLTVGRLTSLAVILEFSGFFRLEFLDGAGMKDLLLNRVSDDKVHIGAVVWKPFLNPWTDVSVWYDIVDDVSRTVLETRAIG